MIQGEAKSKSDETLKLSLPLFRMIHEAYQFMTQRIKRRIRRRKSCAVGLLNAVESKKEANNGEEAENTTDRPRAFSIC